MKITYEKVVSPANLNEAKNEENQKGGEQKGPKKVEIIASLCCPECVEGQTDGHYTR